MTGKPNKLIFLITFLVNSKKSLQKEPL